MDTKEIEKRIIEKTITEIKSFATKIRAYCFYNCDALTSADFPNATSIGGDAFHNCTSLTSVSFPNATSIGANALDSCTSLTSVSFPNATSIGGYAFSGCDNLELHLYTGIDSISNIGGISITTVRKPPKAVYFHYNEADEVLFSPAGAIGAGSSKGTLTYNIYTDNTIIKDGVLSKADQYTIVNVKHLDGSDW